MMYSNDVEAGLGSPGDNSYNVFQDKAVRNGFIRKVYGIVSVQLLVTFSFLLIPIYDSDVQKWAIRNPWLLIVSTVATLIIMIVLACCNVHRSFPANYICLGIFTLAESVLFLFLGAVTNPRILLYAVLATFAVCLALTLFAFQTKYDFTVYNGIMFALVVILFILGLVRMFIYSNTLNLIYAGLGALIFSAYLVIDTQMIVGGSHKNQFSAEDYVMAAITIYVDVINIFLFILQLLNSTQD